MNEIYKIIGFGIFWLTIGFGGFYVCIVVISYITHQLAKTELKHYWNYYIMRKVIPTEFLRRNYRLRNIKRS